MPTPVKIHLVLRGYALCDFQFADGGRHATASLAVFKACGPEACKECARKLTKLEAATTRRAA
jgi:hypothetical protein